MQSMKKILVSFMFFFILGSLNICKAEIITSTKLDTYLISLKGDVLNDISALNLTLFVPSKGVDITPSISLSANGASALLSSVTGPDAERYTLSVVLNGMITDGSATITGKLIEESIVKDAEFLITKVERDGGIDITDKLDISIVFNDTDFVSEKEGEEGEEQEDPEEANNGNEDIVSEEPDTNTSPPEVSIVDVLLDDNPDIDPDEIEKVIAKENEANLSVRINQNVILKNKGLNKAYYRVSGSIDKHFAFDGSLNRIACYADAFQLSMAFLGFEKVPYMKSKSPILSGRLGKTGTKYRFSKRGAINIYPDGEGKDLFEGKADYTHVYLLVSCILFEYSEDLDRYFVEKLNKSLLRANLYELLAYFEDSPYLSKKHKLFDGANEFDVYPPKNINLGQD